MVWNVINVLTSHLATWFAQITSKENWRNVKKVLNIVVWKQLPRNHQVFFELFSRVLRYSKIDSRALLLFVVKQQNFSSTIKFLGIWTIKNLTPFEQTNLLQYFAFNSEYILYRSNTSVWRGESRTRSRMRERHGRYPPKTQHIFIIKFFLL